MILAVVLALGAALSNAVNLMTQHLASVASPPGVTGVRLARYLIRQPMWLLGAAAGVGSYILQAGALNNGPLSVVQPLLITELIFVMVLRRVWIHQHVRPAAWASVLTVAGALAVFLAAAEPTGGQPAPQAAAMAVRRGGVRRDHRRPGAAGPARVAGAPGRHAGRGRRDELGHGGGVPEDRDRNADRVRPGGDAHQLAGVRVRRRDRDRHRARSRPRCTSAR